MERRILSITILFMLLGAGLLLSDSQRAQVGTPTTPAACNPIPPPPCKEGASPGVVQIIPDSNTNKSKLGRKRFFLSSCPFNLAASLNLATAPLLRSFYGDAGASPQLISWLEENHCETVYCRQLTKADATCEGIDPNKCVPEFTMAYRNALADLEGNTKLALKMITNYPPLSAPKLRTGFYEARTEWLKNGIAKLESPFGGDYRIRTTVTDKDGVGFFYDLCPGFYYISSMAPIDVDGVGMVWETAKPIKVDGPPNVNTATKMTIAFPPSKDKKNFTVGRSLPEVLGQKPAQ
jgi:hypothetical protein